VETASFFLGGELALGGVSDGTEALGLGDEALGDAAEFFGLGLGGLDALVGDEVGREVAEHGPAVAGVTAEFAACIEVAHGRSSYVGGGNRGTGRVETSAGPRGGEEG
jgi:hypothetical protein